MTLSDQIQVDYPDEPISFVISVIKQSFPDFSVERKKDSLICRIFAALVYVFNRDFLSKGSFALFDTVYVGDSTERVLESVTGRRAYCSTLVHEFTHLLDQQEDGKVRFILAYLFPQVLALAAVLALLAFIWWPAAFLLLSLVALAPWPAKYRLNYEVRGYAVGNALFRGMFSKELAQRKWDSTQEALQSSAYYYMVRGPCTQWLSCLIYEQKGPFQYPQIRWIFDGLRTRGDLND